jgi:hypothetical protein
MATPATTTDLAVGANGDDTGGGDSLADRGALYVLLLNSDGTVKSSHKIAHQVGAGPTLQDRDLFGSSVAPLGDLDGDGVVDLAVGARKDGPLDYGAVYIFFMKCDGTVKSSQKITSGLSGGPALGNFDSFGWSLASLGDLDGDGVTDLAAAAVGDQAVHILYLKPDGTVKSSQKIASGMGGLPTLDLHFFGWSLASLGDLDGMPTSSARLMRCRSSISSIRRVGRGSAVRKANPASKKLGQ